MTCSTAFAIPIEPAAPTEVTVEHRRDAIGISVARPRLSWIIESAPWWEDTRIEQSPPLLRRTVQPKGQVASARIRSRRMTAAAYFSVVALGQMADGTVMRTTRM